MKIRVIVIPIFFLTFITGCITVFFTLEKNQKTNLKKQTLSKPISIETEKTQNQPVQIKDSFNPQIFDLKDFDDKSDFSEKFKLVDVVNHGSQYREDEVIAKTGQVWLGLFKGQNNYYLRNTKVKVVSDDEFNSADQRWVSINFKGKKNPLFIMRKANKLKEGKIITLFNAVSFEDEEIEENINRIDRSFFRKYELGEQTFSLEVKDALTKSGDKALALILKSGKNSQIVTYGFYSEEYCLGHLLWVGDLDGDNELDFYMKFEDFEKGYFSSSLFLSSEAEKGKLVKEVAGFYSAGC